MAIAGVLQSTSHAQSSARTITRGLDQLTAEADVIIHGHVTSVNLEPHPQLTNLMTVVVTMSVQHTYKGSVPKIFSFRQYVWNADRGSAMAEYAKGQELLLLLRPVSEYGLTSPVGLEQGRFRISTDRKGNVSAVNGRGNVGLFNAVVQRSQARGLRLPARTAALAAQHRGGVIPFQDLQDAIRTFAGTR